MILVDKVREFGSWSALEKFMLHGDWGAAGGGSREAKQNVGTKRTKFVGPDVIYVD